VRRVESLQRTLYEERREHAAEVRRRQARIDGLQADVREKKKSTAKTARDERREAAARTEALARGYSLEETAAAS